MFEILAALNNAPYKTLSTACARHLEGFGIDSPNIAYQLRSLHVNFEQVDRVHSEAGHRP